MKYYFKANLGSIVIVTFDILQCISVKGFALLASFVLFVEKFASYDAPFQQNPFL